MKPSSMSSRLWRGCIVFALLAAGAGALVYAGVRHENAAISNEVNNIHPLEITTLEIRADFSFTQSTLGTYILTRQPLVLVFYRQSRGALSAALDQVASRAGGQLQANVLAQRRALATFQAISARVLALPPGDPALVPLSAEAYPSATAFDAANSRMLAQLQAEDKVALSNAKHVLAQTVAWSAILAGLALLLALLAAFSTIRGITKPLRGLTSTVRRLSAGDHAARAVLAGSLEAREVAQSVNTLADETDRLRAAEEEHSRLSVMAREMGFRIREHLHADDVLRVARAVLEENLDTDVVYLHVMRDGKLGPPEGHADDWILPATFLDDVAPDHFQMLSDLLRTQSSGVIQDVSGPEGGGLPAGAGTPMVLPRRSSTVLISVLTPAWMRRHPVWTPPVIFTSSPCSADLSRYMSSVWLASNRPVLRPDCRLVQSVGTNSTSKPSSL